MKKFLCIMCVLAGVLLVSSCASSPRKSAGEAQEVTEGTKSKKTRGQTETTFGVDASVAENQSSDVEEQPASEPAHAEETIVQEQPEDDGPKGFFETERKKIVKSEVVGQGKVVQKEVYEDLLEDPVTGAKYLKRDRIDLKKGKVHLKLDSYNGTVDLSILPKEIEKISEEEAQLNAAEGKTEKVRKAKEQHVFSLSENSLGSYFSVLLGNREYRLLRKNGARAECRLTEYGAQISYKLVGKIQFIVDFHFYGSYGSEESDVLEVSMYTVNLGRKAKDFTVKAVFASGLGQDQDVLYTTALNEPLNEESDLGRLQNEKWIKVSNADASAKYLLSGNGITPVQSVFIAKKENLSGPSFLPPVIHHGKLASLTDYGTSGIAVIWPKCRISAKKFRCDKFFISLGQAGEEPVDQLFLVKQEPIPLNCYASALSEGESIEDEPENVENVDQYVQGTPTYSKEFLAPYYQRLEAITARIGELEKDPSVANQAEIDRLSAELDKIILELRSFN